MEFEIQNIKFKTRVKPRFEISKKVVLEKFDEVKEVCDVVSYSSKTNSVVTGILEDSRDCLFSVHSVNELKNIEDKSRVMFLCQGWDDCEISYLVGEGVRYFVVDNIQDLETLKNYLKKNPVEGVNLLLRLKLKENTLRTEKYFVFGFMADYINKNLLILKEIPGIVSVGIHFHRKTQNVAEWGIQGEIEDVLSEEVLQGIDYMVIGGGLPSVYANTNIKIFSGIFDKIRFFRAWLNSKNVKMIVEPGRYIAAPAGKLITHVKAIYGNNIIVDASVYNSDLDALIVPVKLLVEGEVQCTGCGEDNGVKNKKIVQYVIKGITPCSMDLFRYRVYLDEKKVGDEVVFLNAGAYNFTTNFCDLDEIETLIVD
jgi:ornithine decarboxylase